MSSPSERESGTFVAPELPIYQAELRGTGVSAEAAFSAAGALLLADRADLVFESFERLIELAPAFQLTPHLRQLEALLSELSAKLASLTTFEDNLDGESEHHATTLALTALKKRHQVAQFEQALALIEPEKPPLTGAEEAQLSRIDDELRRVLFRLVPLSGEREIALREVHPDFREATWWYSAGLDVPRDALGALDSAAALIAAFPEAAAELSHLVDGEQAAANMLSRERPLAALPSAVGRRSSRPEAAAAAVIAPNTAATVGPWKWLAVAAAAGLILAVGAGGLLIQSSQEQAKAERAALEQELEALEEEQVEAQATLRQRLADAEILSQLQRTALEAELSAARAKSDSRPAAAAMSARPTSAGARAKSDSRPAAAAMSARPTSAGAKAKPGKASPSAGCKPGDPMCGGL